MNFPNFLFKIIVLVLALATFSEGIFFYRHFQRRRYRNEIARLQALGIAQSRFVGAQPGFIGAQPGVLVG